jgi:xylulokinase
MLSSQSSAKSIFAIDLGTSGPKVALVAPDGRVLAHGREETPTLFLPGGGAEQKPEDWWRAIVCAARALLAQQAVPVESISIISVTSQYSCTVAVDSRGAPLMNAINWMDTRGAHDIRKVVGGWPSFEGYGLTRLMKWIRLTGGAPTLSGKDPIAHILYIKREHPEIYAAAHKFLEPKDYLNHRLTGRFAATEDSINLHWLTDNRDVNDIHYDDGLIALTGVDPDKLPEIVRSTDILGPLLPAAASELGLPPGIPVVGGTTDFQSSAIGSGAVRDFEAHLYVGTSSWISCFVPFRKTDLLHSIASLPSAIPGRYSVANEQECAGSCLAFLRDNLIYPDDDLALGPAPECAYERFDAVAALAPPGSERLLFLPWMYGERTPVEDASVRGGFLNLSLKTRRATMVRAVMEGVAFNSRWLLSCVESFCGKPFDGINMIGGGARSALWCQIYADILNRTIRQVDDPLGANARGAGLIGSIALGCSTFDDIHRHVEIARTFQPDPANRAIYDELFREFLKAYRQNKAMFRRLNKVA